MALEEYKRKRRFSDTPEPPPSVPKEHGNRFVVQKHKATRLHYDFRLEMEGVLKSWAVPKGPTLDPGEKRLAMMTEDHPVSYFDFEGIIPPGNYGAGTVMVWDVGTWEPLPPPGVKDASAMLEKGDLKFRLYGNKINGEFALVRMRSRRADSRGNEWLLIKKRDAYVKEGYDAEAEDWSVLTQRSLSEIAGDEGSREWQSDRPATAGVSKKNAWLAEALKKSRAKEKPSAKTKSSRAEPQRAASASKKKAATRAPAGTKAKKKASAPELAERLAALEGAKREPVPQSLHPMLATLTEKPFDHPEWLYEIKWDGYRALAYISGGRVRLVSRKQNELTAQFPELAGMPALIAAEEAVVDGEVVALDEGGRPSFSLMQQRTGMDGGGGTRRGAQPVAIVFYAFDLPWVAGYSLARVDLEQRKELLSQLLTPGERVRYSGHFDNGCDLYEVAKAKGLEGIIAKRRRSCYEARRSREWLKVKITRRIECVIGGYTDPKGSREHFGSIVLGLYDKEGRLIPVGQAGSGFTQKTHAEMWKKLKAMETDKSPFHGKPDSPRRVHFVRPELVAEIKFNEWTHEGQKGRPSLRAPVYQGLRADKSPRECTFEEPQPAPSK